MRIAVFQVAVSGFLLLCSSCYTYRYHPQRQQFYELDSVNRYHVNLDVYYPLHFWGTQGAGVGSAVSLHENVALTAHGYYRFDRMSRSNNSGTNANYAEAFSSSEAFGGGGGVLFHGLLTAREGYAVSLAYDHQNADWSFRAQHGDKRFEETFRGPVHGVSVLPSLTIYTSEVTVHAACGVTGLFTRSKNFSNAPTPDKYYSDLLIEPGVAVSNGLSMVGFSVNVSPNHSAKAPTNTFYEYWRYVPFNVYWRGCVNKRTLNKFFSKQR